MEKVAETIEFFDIKNYRQSPPPSTTNEILI